MVRQEVKENKGGDADFMQLGWCHVIEPEMLLCDQCLDYECGARDAQELEVQEVPQTDELIVQHLYQKERLTELSAASLLPLSLQNPLKDYVYSQITKNQEKMI